MISIMSPQYRAYTRALLSEKSASPLFPTTTWGGGGAANSWCIMETHKIEGSILHKCVQKSMVDRVKYFIGAQAITHSVRVD